MNVRVFLFHRVTPESVPWAPGLDPSEFERCCKFIKKRYDVHAIEAITQNPDQFRNKKLACITFDDGFSDNFQFAAPILDSLKLPASFYVVSDCIDSGKPTWTHDFYRYFYSSPTGRLSLNVADLPEKLTTTNWTNIEDGIRVADALFSAFRNMSHKSIEDCWRQIQLQLNGVPEMDSMMMSWQEVKILGENGHKIGSHSHTHPMLGTINSLDDLTFELNKSKERIKEKTGISVETISYPVGHYNAHVISQSKIAGYRLGLAVNQVMYSSETHDSFEIPRIDLYADLPNWKRNILMMGNWHTKIQSLRSWVKK